MTVEELIGRRITAVREALGIPQADLGQRLGTTLGTTWTRQQVSRAEHGHRAFTAAELIALAYALDVPIADLLTPPEGVTEVQLPSGDVVGYRTVPGAGVATRVLGELRRLEETATRRAQIEQQERDLVNRLIARLADTDDLNDAERAAIADAVRGTTNEAIEDT